MHPTLKFRAVSALIAVTLALSGTALAQTPSAPPGQAYKGAIQPKVDQSMVKRVEQRIADLHTRLHITAAQQSQWDQFAQVMRDNANTMRDAADDRATKVKSMNASENMQSYAQLAAQHAQGLQNLAAAFQPLYESFSDEQKQMADAMFRDVAMRHGRGLRGK